MALHPTIGRGRPLAGERQGVAGRSHALEGAFMIEDELGRTLLLEVHWCMMLPRVPCPISGTAPPTTQDPDRTKLA